MNGRDRTPSAFIQVLKMCPGSRIFAKIVILLAVDSANSLQANTSTIHSSPTSKCSKLASNNCNCNCNVHTSSISDPALVTLEDKLDHIISLVNKTAAIPQLPPTLIPAAADPVFSCKDQFDKDNSSQSKVYELTFGSQKLPVYCHMGNFGCGQGGWTLAMKTDGIKSTFHFNSHVWTDKYSFNPEGGKTGFDSSETKLPTYCTTPFSKICLGMKRIGQKINFIVIRKNATSLFSLIADGIYRATSLGRDKWKSLIGNDASLQLHCDKEGFNTVGFRTETAKARIGFLGNNQNHCGLCDSRIGFGTGGTPDDSGTCGNEAADRYSDNGPKSIKTMGYILVQ
ncbi:putative skeletal organic matrix protein 5 [Acropora palmata]|uniref:putative skeletal organic matrix protein 5 n=1 Tax=Acropora palmata TaxID=6131 RepID=UPI003DA026F9